MTDNEMINNFISTKQNNEEALTLDFARAILDCELQKKEIADDIKAIKDDAKVNGILVQHVMKAVKALKQEIKTDELDKRETQAMFDLLASDNDIRFKIESLLTK